LTDSPFDETYFSRGPYAGVSFRRFSQYWWSNRFYARLVERFGPRQGRVLEVGCGLGHLLARLPARFEVHGTDVNPWALARAAQVVPRARLQEASAEDLAAFEADWFDVVVAKHVVEHLQHPETAIGEFARILRPGGVVILATPNLDSPMRVRKGKGWIGYQDPTHISLLEPERWLAMLRAAGITPERVYSDGFWDPPYVAGLPTALQKVLFGLPGGLQAVLSVPLLPLSWGESMIVIARNGGQ
jgi:SAM-dependent methyltransferase